MKHKLDLIADVVQLEALHHDVFAALLQFAERLLLLDLFLLLIFGFRAIDVHSVFYLRTDGPFSHFLHGIEARLGIDLQLIGVDLGDHLLGVLLLHDVGMAAFGPPSVDQAHFS